MTLSGEESNIVKNWIKNYGKLQNNINRVKYQKNVKVSRLGALKRHKESCNQSKPDQVAENEMHNISWQDVLTEHTQTCTR